MSESDKDGGAPEQAVGENEPKSDGEPKRNDGAENAGGEEFADGQVSEDLIELSRRDKVLRVVSYVISGFWLVCLLPLFPMSCVAGISTLMMSDSGRLSDSAMGTLSLCSDLFMATPYVIIICLIISQICRKERILILSIVIQLLPAVCPILAYSILHFTFWSRA